MKGEVPKPLIGIIVVVVVAVAGFFLYSAGKPLASEKPLPDASTMTADEIAKLKNADHAADEARGRK